MPGLLRFEGSAVVRQGANCGRWMHGERECMHSRKGQRRHHEKSGKPYRRKLGVLRKLAAAAPSADQEGYVKSFASALSRAFLAFGLASVHVSGASARDASATVSLDKHYSVRRGTAEYQAIERFVASRIASYHGAFGTADSLAAKALGDVVEVTLRYSYGSVSAAVVPMPAPTPPWLPDGPSPSAGDTASVHSCAAKAGLDQRWEFAFVPDGAGGGAWVVAKYDGSHVTSCPAGF